MASIITHLRLGVYLGPAGDRNNPSVERHIWSTEIGSSGGRALALVFTDVEAIRLALILGPGCFASVLSSSYRENATYTQSILVEPSWKTDAKTAFIFLSKQLR